MTVLVISMRNAKFVSRDDGSNYSSVDEALAAGVDNAAILVAEEIIRGCCSSAVEVSVEGEDGSVLLSAVVSLSVSPLLAPSASATHQWRERDCSKGRSPRTLRPALPSSRDRAARVKD